MQIQTPDDGSSVLVLSVVYCRPEIARAQSQSSVERIISHTNDNGVI
jgi:hypothetical protein